jgi:hypothetical protein
MNERVDSEGRPAKFRKGDRVFVMPVKQEATVIRQILHYDMNETFWGNLELEYDDGTKGVSHGWQVKRIEE